MSHRLTPADEPVRLRLRTLFEQDRHDWTLDTIPFLHTRGIDRYAMARAVLEHLARGRRIYVKWSDDRSHVLDRQYHAEVELQPDGGEVVYAHFTFSIRGDRVRFRAHLNHFPGSLPW